MARRYVRDKIGRFASHGGGGGSFGGGGKIGKSAKNVKARKAYKSASSKVRKADRDFKTADRKSSAARGAYTRSAGKGPAKAQQAAGKWHASMVKREQAARKIGGSKSGLTRVTNRLTGKGAANAKRRAVNPNKLASSKKYATARKARKGSAVRKDAVASAKIRRGERRVKAAKKTTATKKAVTAKIETTKKTNKAPSAFGGTSKYARQGKVSKASQGSGAKQKYKKAVSTKRLLTGGAKANVSPSKAGGQAKAKVTRLNKSLRKGVKQGTGYAISDKGKAAKQRFTQLKRERGGATKGTGTAAQKRAGMSYRKSVAAFGGTTKGRVPKGSMPGTKTQKQWLKEMPRKQSFTGKGSKAKRRIEKIKGRKG